MWIAIFLAVILCFALGIAFLVWQIARLIQKSAHCKKGISVLWAALLLGAFIAVLWAAMDFINCIIVVLHLLLIWMLFNAGAWLLSRCGRKCDSVITALAALAVTALYLAGGWHAAHHVVATQYCLKTEKNVTDLRIIQISDSHLGTLFHADKLTEYLEEIQKQNPDVVLITGDFVDDSTSREDMLAGCEALKILQPTYGTYFVYGNHDRGYYSENRRGWTNRELEKGLTDAGVVILQDEAVPVGNDFYIVGREDYSVVEAGGTRMTPESLLKNLNHEKYIIVLDHQPKDYAEEAAAGADLVISGHTHGGQLIPITYVGEWMGVNCRTYGMEQKGDTVFEVSSGIGDWAILFKTGCKSEYVIFDLVSK